MSKKTHLKVGLLSDEFVKLVDLSMKMYQLETLEVPMN
jgi:hypothetical protein